MSVRTKRSARIERWLLTAGTVILFLALILQPEITASAVTRAMESFGTRLVPVLYPYMVLSHFFCTYSLLDPLDALLPVGRLFGMGKGAFPVFLMGHLCGYPVGAKMAAEMVRQGRLGQKQGAVLCAVSSGASPAFLLHVVGGALWNDLRCGLFLLVLQILLGLAGGVLLGRKTASEAVAVLPVQDPVPFSRCFCEAAGGSALQLVSIGGYIVFFSLLVEIFPLPGIYSSAAASLLEFSTGTRLAAQTGGLRGLFLTGFAAGWGGLSVLAQTAHMLSGSGISLRPYVGFKLVSGFLCGLSVMGYGMLFPELRLAGSVSAGVTTGVDGVWLAVFGGMLGMMWYSGGSRRDSGR